MPRRPNSTEDRLDRIETMLAGNRLDRLERAIERTTENLDEFRAIVRGAITAQQDQIQENRRQIAEFRETVSQVVREWQAYLRTIHPPQ